MDLDRLAASFFVVGFEGTEPSPEVQELLRRGASGAILFQRNLADLEQICALNNALRAAAPGPIVLSVDQEGGRVARLRGICADVPAMRVVAERCGPADVRALAELMGRELRALGFDLDFAPVLDVDTNPENPVIGDRAFSSHPDLVAEYGAAFVRGLQAAGVAACGKHFPGHGDTSEDSHESLPRVRAPLERLRTVELVPFERAMRAGVATLMTAHVVYEALDPERPATLSPETEWLLREEMRYDGVLVSDDLEMKALAAYGIEDAVRGGISAGVDLFLACRSADVQAQAIDALRRLIEAREISPARLEASRRRVERLKASYSGGPVEAAAARAVLSQRFRDQLIAGTPGS